MSIASLILSNYIMVAVLLGLWVMLGSNVHLSKRMITAIKIVIILIFAEAVCWAVERYTREIGHLTMTRIILTPTIYLLHPDDKEAVLKEFNDTIADYSGAKNYDVEYRFKVKSGEWRWFHAIGRLLRRDNGVPLSYVGMFVDITDRKKKEKL